MITQEQGRAFAEEWIAAWNARDLGRVLSHYTDDFEMSSPKIARIADEPSGVLRGKPRIGEYWRKALERVPDLRFELLDVFTGADSLAVYYRGAEGWRAVEVFFFDSTGKVRKACANYDEV